MGGRLFSSRVLAVIGVSLVSLVGCCLLAWWQWSRFESASGTLQNLGYVLQWPLFGLFPAFMFWRMWRMDRGAAAQAGDDVEATEPAAQQPVEAAEPTRSPAAYVQNRTVVHDDDDGEMAAYNAYLARLNAREDRHAR